MKYNPNDYRLPLTDAQEAELLALGQAEADRQTLEALVTGTPWMHAMIDVAAAYGVSIEDAVQEWRDLGVDTGE